MPVTVLGLACRLRVKRLLLLTLWSSRNEYRLVPSNTGKFPSCDASVWYEDGTKHVPGVLHVVGNPPIPAFPPVNPRGHAPLTACPEEAPVKNTYSPTSVANPGTVPSAFSTSGFVRNEISFGVNCTTPKGNPPPVVSKSDSPNPPCPILEKPVSCRRVVS